MKLGIFDLEVIECNGGWFQPILKINGETIQTYGIWKIKKYALDAGTKGLEELFQGALDQLTKPKYQTKSKTVDAVQWFPTGLESNMDNSSAYSKGIFIKPGDWIVDGVIIINEDFGRDYEAIT